MSTQKPNWLNYIWLFLFAAAAAAQGFLMSVLRRKGTQADATKAEQGEVNAESALDSQLAKDEATKELEQTLEQIKNSEGDYDSWKDKDKQLK